MRDFNPRPREEGDNNCTICGADFEHFNPRPREEGDAAIADETNAESISIHALVKRATCNLCDSFVKIVYFNPRPREEGDVWR